MKWFAILVLAGFGVAFATASLAAKVELTFQLNTAIQLTRLETMEQAMVDAINLNLDKHYIVEELTVQSQTLLLNSSSLQVILILEYTQSNFHHNIFVRSFLDQVENAFQFGELNDLITYHLGTILSAKAFYESDSPGTTEPAHPINLPLLTSSDIEFPNQTYSSTVSQSFYLRTYYGNLTVQLPGLSTEIPKEDFDIVEWITQTFIQDNLPLVQNLILDVRKVYVSNQTLAYSSRRHRRLNMEHSIPVMHVSFLVIGEGWSMYEEILNELLFDDFIRRGFVSPNEPDYFASLHASSDSFRDLNIPNDNGTVSVEELANDNSGNGRDTLVIVAITVTVVGAALVGGICLVVMFHRKPEASMESNSSHDEEVQNDWWEIKDEESLPSGVLQLDSPSHHAFPVQKRRQDSDASLRSPSILGDSDVENWSVASVRSLEM